MIVLLQKLFTIFNPVDSSKFQLVTLTIWKTKLYLLVTMVRSALNVYDLVPFSSYTKQ